MYSKMVWDCKGGIGGINWSDYVEFWGWVVLLFGGLFYCMVNISIRLKYCYWNENRW